MFKGQDMTAISLLDPGEVNNPVGVTGVEPGGEDFGAEKVHSLYQKFSEKYILVAYCRSVLVSGVVPSRTRFLRQKNHSLNRKKWNAHGVILTYRVTPGFHMRPTI
jgi:hypothetical protein